MAELRWQKLYSSQQSGATTVPTPTTTEPTLGGGVIRAEDATSVRLSFFGTGSDGNQATAIIYGWSNTFDDLWIPTLLTKMVVKLGTTTGVDGTSVEDEYKFCDQIVHTDGEGDDNVIVIENGDNTIASAIQDTRGSYYIEVGFDPTGMGTVDDINGLIGTL